MMSVTNEFHRRLARKLKSLWNRYQSSRDLLSVGAYVPGSDPLTDRAIECSRPWPGSCSRMETSIADLQGTRAALETLGPALDADVMIRPALLRIADRPQPR
jgi:flagellum-specific ATP synthase